MNEAEPRRRLGHAKRADAILGEALRLFATRHHAMVTIREIASACGVNPALIYYYFDSKEHLFRRALEHAIETLRAGYLARAPESLAPMEAIAAWLDTNANIAPLVLQMVKLMADYATDAAKDPAIDAAIKGFYRLEQDILETALGRGVETGVFRAFDVAQTARFIGLHLDGIFYAAASRGDDRVLADVAHLERFLRHYLSAPRQP